MVEQLVPGLFPGPELREVVTTRRAEVAIRAGTDMRVCRMVPVVALANCGPVRAAAAYCGACWPGTGCRIAHCDG